MSLLLFDIGLATLESGLRFLNSPVVDPDQSVLNGLAILAVPIDPAITRIGQGAAIKTGQLTGTSVCGTARDEKSAPSKPSKLSNSTEPSLLP